MGGFFGTIGRGLRKLVSFSGRDTLSQFWFYAGAVIAVTIAAMVALMGPMMTSSIAKMQRFAAEHPDQAEVRTGPGSYSISIHGNHPELMPDLTGLATGMSVISGIALVLLASAVARRLHDRGKGGYWGLPAAIFLVIGLVAMPRVFDDFAHGNGNPDMRLFGFMFLNNLLYLAALAVLVVQLVLDGTRGPNRFGDDPRR
ncbi:MAG: hypothetical protein JWN66_4117 [Sphingomonas bacterium]|uniref:DUF805 domain-containing protein n=1 Tax=Sphingomonas bacterium TaxID=1895847 RepID=UPI0026229A88|nr:DUF805 domain-containing protein [Sphingomonas bacterium]MDB5707001.1 hypothetical protein [Sphingomonas bacterium]